MKKIGAEGGDFLEGWGLNSIILIENLIVAMVSKSKNLRLTEKGSTSLAFQGAQNLIRWGPEIIEQLL